MLQKRKQPRSEEYLEWVRGQQSIASQSSQYIVAHHVRCFGWGGMGLKPSDYRTVPLTHGEHMELHQHGEIEFWESQDIDPRTYIAAQLLIYLRDYLHCPLSNEDMDSISTLEFNELIEALEDRVLEIERYRQ
jgi:Protein of unknown function (DUF968)